MVNQEVLPLDILQKTVCSECFKYLTVLPVIQNKDGAIICGRHQNSSAVKSVFNTIMSNYRFKCVNHFDGCEVILDTATSKQHEKKCKFESHECFFCSYKGNWCQILQHSFKEHPLNVTKVWKFSFKIGTKSFQKLLYYADDTIYLVTVDITTERFSLTLSVIAENDFKVNQYAVQFARLPNQKKDDNTILDYTYFNKGSNNYFEKNIEELTFHFGCNTVLSCQILLSTVHLSEKALELEKRFALYSHQLKKLIEHEKSLAQLKCEVKEQTQTMEGLSKLVKKISSTLLKCSNCKHFVGNAIYLCPQNHSYCKDCLSSTCKFCNDFCEYTRIMDLDKIVFLCDWPQCHQYFNLVDYLEHKSNCLCRPYKCPARKCLDIVCSIQKFVDHWHYCGVPLEVKENIEFVKYGDYEFFWIIRYDLYHGIIKFQPANLQIIIEDNNVLSAPLKFKVEGFYNNLWTQMPKDLYISGKYVLISSGCNSSGNQVSKIRISVENLL